ncbi:hypothetical protein HOY80DRAFT_992186 [Tuber brumale]|nr:hypothetical protein HOY80DRAFT_992186 [Tuber brumale]
MADLPTPKKIPKLKPFPDFPPPPPPTSETSTSSSPTSSIPSSSSSRSLPPVVLSSSNPISRRRYKNSGSFSQPLRPTVYPPAGVPDSTSSQAMDRGVLTREDSSSSQQSRESIHSAGPSINPAKGKNALKQHEAVVADIMSEIGQLQIFQLGDASVENLLARNDIPENATLLQDFRKGVKSGDIKAPVSSSSLSSVTATKPPAELPPRPRKLHRRPRKNSEKSTIHGGIISHPIEASKDIHPGEISQPVTVADAVLQYSPYESLRSYNLSQSTVEEEEKFYTDLIGQINKNIVSQAESSTPTRDSYASTSSAGKSVGSNGTVGDLSSEQLLAARKANTERYGW